MYPKIEARIAEFLQQFNTQLSNEELASILVKQAVYMLMVEEVLTFPQAGEILVTVGTLIEQFKHRNANEGGDTVLALRPTR